MPATLKRQTKKKKTPKARLTVTPVQSQAAKGAKPRQRMGVGSRSDNPPSPVAVPWRSWRLGGLSFSRSLSHSLGLSYAARCEKPFSAAPMPHTMPITTP